MNDEDYMRVVLQDAYNAKKIGNLPSASILVKNHEIISRGTSCVAVDFDPSAHGDMVCIRKACAQLQSLDLSKCALYSIIEPCAMCLTCAAWASMSKVVFGAYKEDILENSYLVKGYHAVDFGRNLSTYDGNRINIVGGVLRDECTAIMSNVINWQIKQ